MEITSKIEFKEYLIFAFNALFKQLLLVLVLGLCFIFILDSNDIFLNIIMLLSILFFIFLVLFISYRSVKKTYFSSNMLRENVIYKFTKEMFYIIGETFKSEINWKNIHKVIEKKNWFLVYHSSMVANLISKKTSQPIKF